MVKEDTSNSSSNCSSLCEECKLNESKYKCPGCSIRSCSLTCVKSHKQRTSCSGKREITKFLPTSQFDDNVLISDYHLLEDVKRVAESAQRTRFKVCGISHNLFLPGNLKSLRKAALSRRTKLQFLSTGMSMREKNKSFYDNRKKAISWTIEWRFHPINSVIIDHRVMENKTLSSVIENHLKPGPWNHELKQFSDEPLESLKFFIPQFPKGQKSPYRQLDINAPIRDQLSNIFILEYPVIHVFLPSHPINFELMKDIKSTNQPNNSLKDSEPDNNEPSPKGITFREEEIEDDDSTDTRVLDMMEQVKPDQTLSETENELTSCLAIDEESPQQIEKPVDLESMDFDFDFNIDFDFDQASTNPYLDLLPETSLTNLEEFLGLEDVFPGAELELEEGEIS